MTPFNPVKVLIFISLKQTMGISTAWQLMSISRSPWKRIICKFFICGTAYFLLTAKLSDGLLLLQLFPILLLKLTPFTVMVNFQHVFSQKVLKCGPLLTDEDVCSNRIAKEIQSEQPDKLNNIFFGIGGFLFWYRRIPFGQNSYYLLWKVSGRKRYWEHLWKMK